VQAIESGRVDLRHGSVERLPFADHTFDKGLAINSLQVWPATPSTILIGNGVSSTRAPAAHTPGRAGPRGPARRPPAGAL
jgi:hypothetical protein